MPKNPTSGMPLVLLHYFRQNTRRVLPREELAEKVWRLRLYPRSRTVDMTVSTLRRQLAGERIITVNGCGYQHEFDAARLVGFTLDETR